MNGNAAMEGVVLAEEVMEEEELSGENVMMINFIIR